MSQSLSGRQMFLRQRRRCDIAVGRGHYLTEKGDGYFCQMKGRHALSSPAAGHRMNPGFADAAERLLFERRQFKIHRPVAFQQRAEYFSFYAVGGAVKVWMRVRCFERKCHRFCFFNCYHCLFFGLQNSFRAAAEGSGFQIPAGLYDRFYFGQNLGIGLTQILQNCK